jgi:Spy/CpxP family protein refolding chaperone
MKRLIIAALLVIGISSYAQEQTQSGNKSDKPKKEKMTPEQKNQAVLDKMTTELSLDAKQQELIKPIIAQQSAKFQAMKEERMANGSKEMSDDEKEAMKQKRKEDKKAVDSQLKTILTPEQFKKMKENEAANKEKMREHREAKEQQMEE